MAGSTISLDSLSSPSPSPSPPPELSKPAEPTSAGLDSDSELSELTEEEQETEKRNEDQGSSHKGIRSHDARRGRRPSRRGGRRKTSSMVPAPMWGWAEVKSSNVVEEEEEEEMAGPPKAMEEEEDEEADEDEEGSLSGQPRPSLGKNPADDLPELEETSGIPITNGADEEGSVSGDDGPPYKSTHLTRRSARSYGTPIRALGNDPELTNSEDEADPLDKNKATAKEEHDLEDEDEDEDGFDTKLIPTGPDVDSENETESEDEDSKEAKLDGDETPIAPAAPLNPASVAEQLTAAFMDVDVDVTAPPLKDIAPLAAAAAASSIMAGSTVAHPLSPSPSSSASGSRASSRSPSPALSAKRLELESADADAVSLPKQAKSNAILPHSKASPLALDMDAELPEPYLDNDNERSTDDIDVDDGNLDDDLEVESDLQPAHRAEALDVLASIELKFAHLRECVYIEKMEGLAWEETLIGEGTHPELIHLHRELSQRRDKRIELATQKRSFDTENVTKRRRADEDATWSWWMLARDDLQTDMISETNRKRRRLERERRAVERPQPIRRIPNFPLDVPAPPSLRKVIKTFPFHSHSRNKRDRRYNTQELIYPELSTLPPADISNDLEFLFQTRDRRPTYYMHGSLGIPQGLPMTRQHGYDDYVDDIMLNPFGGGGHRMHPSAFQHHAQPPLPLQHGGPGSGFPPYNGANLPRTHQPLHPPPMHNQVHHLGPSQFNADQEIAIITGPGQILPHQTYFGSQSGVSGSNGYASGTPQLRRSPSPQSGPPNGAGGKPNGTWMGAGGPHSAPVKVSVEWHRDGRRAEAEEEERDKLARERDKRERDKELEREREREHREKEREKDREREHQQDLDREHRETHHMQQQIAQQQHRHPSSQHHLHGVAPVQPPHHHISGPHHHHRPHHHHVLHHHHNQPQPQSSSSTGHTPVPLPSSNLGPLRSPRSSREHDNGRPHSHAGHNQHPTEIINLSSKPMHWKGEEHGTSPEYREVRNKHASRLMSSTVMDDRERPLAMPFVIPSSHASQQSNIPPVGPPPNNISSPRGTWDSHDDASFRIPAPASSSTSGYLGVHDGHNRSPGHRYNNSSAPSHFGRGPPPPQPSRQNSLGLSPPRRALPPSPSSSSPAFPSNPNPVRSPARFGPPPNHSPPVGLKMRPPSPLANKMLTGPLPSGPPPASVYSPRLSGPGRTATPTADVKNGVVGSGVSSTYPISNRASSPLMPLPSPSSHPNLPTPLPSRVSLSSTNALGDRERERERHNSPRLGVLPQPSKMSLPQMVDGH